MEKQEYGQLIKDSGIIIKGGIEYSVYNYISGIEKFDEYLKGTPFSETEFFHAIAWFEHSIVFCIFDSKVKISEAFPRSEFVSIEEEKNTKIKIQNINKFTKGLRNGNVGGGGLLGGAIFKVAGIISDEINNKFVTKSSKEVEGTVFKFIFKNELKGEYVVKVSCENQNLHDSFKFMMYKDFSKPLESSSSGACYIATVCYGDNLAFEVIKFREFRDKVLKFNYFGKIIIKFYYKYAESLSKNLVGKEKINKLIKNLILNPLLSLIKIYFNFIDKNK